VNSRRLLWLGLAVALTVPVLLLTGPGLVAVPDRVPGLEDSDATLLFYANRDFLRRSLAEKELPLWNPYNMLGYPQYAAGQSGVFYPPTYLIYPWFTTGHALFADLTLHLVLLGLTTAYLARTIGIGSAGAVLAAFATTLSPLLVLRVHAGHLTVLTTLAWIPLLAASAIRMLRGERKACFAGALALALATNAGHIQPLFYALAFGLPLVAIALLLRRDGRPLSLLIVSITVGIGLGAVQLLPLAELSTSSSREEVTLEWQLQYSTRPFELAAILGPEIFGDRGQVPYWGRLKVWETLPAFGFSLTVLGLLAPMLAGPRRAVLPMALVIGSILLALGLDLPFARLAVTVVPGFASFRAHARILLLGLIPLALLAGHSADELVHRADRTRWPAVLLSLTISLAVLTLAFTASHAPDHTWNELLGSLYSPGESFDRVEIESIVPAVKKQVVEVLRRDAVLAFWISLWVTVSGFRPLGKVGLVVLILPLVLDYMGGALKFRHTRPAPSVSEETKKFLATRPPGSRVVFDQYYPPTLCTLLGVDSPGGSVSLTPRRTHEFLLGTQGRSARDVVSDTVACIRCDGPARILGVARWVTTPLTGWSPPGMRAVNSPGRDRFYEDPNPWPRVWCVGQVRWCSDDKESLSLVCARSFRFDKEAVIVGTPRDLGLPPPGPTPGSNPTERAPGIAKVLTRTSCSVSVEVRLERPGLLVLAESYDPGWSATGPNGPLEVLRVNHALRGVPLPAGHSEVVFRYRPVSFGLAVALSLGSLLVLMVMAFRIRIQRPQ